MSTSKLLFELEKAKASGDKALVYEIEQILDARV